MDSIKSQEELTKAVTALDKELFDAYNTCDLEKLGTLVADDLEFYHDKSGLAVGKKPFLDAIKNNICGKVTRQLVPGTWRCTRSMDMARWRLGCTGFIIRLDRQTRTWWVKRSL